MSQYDMVYEEYDWQDAWEAFDGDRNQFNLGHETVGKHAESNDIAIRILDFEDDNVTELSYADLNDLACQFAGFLDHLGVEQGGRVAVMMDSRPELYSAITGTLLGGRVLVPLYTLFGPEAVNYRLDDSETSVLVTTPKHYEKVDDAALNTLKHVVLVDGDRESVVHPFEAVRERETQYSASRTAAEDLAIIQYTSGTTGSPKGALKPHLEPVILHPYIKYAVDLRSDDVYFSTASPAWAYGLIGSTLYSLHTGCGLNTFRGQFDPGAFLDAIEDLGVTNLFAAPTAYRKLAQLDIDPDTRDVKLRIAASMGEPLDSESVEWLDDLFGVPILDGYGATELGAPIANYTFDDWKIKPGSMGKPMPGYDVELLSPGENEPVEQGAVGEIASRLQGEMNTIRNRSHGYLGRPEETAQKFSGEWIRSGDLARRDEDGYVWFEGRADDVIISAGYRIGPTEVEASLLKHEAVAETAVVGVPDEERGEIVAAFVVPDHEVEPNEELKDNIRTDVKSRLSKHEYPRVIEFRSELPTTQSGKIQRFKLRENYER